MITWLRQASSAGLMILIVGGVAFIEGGNVAENVPRFSFMVIEASGSRDGLQGHPLGRYQRRPGLPVLRFGRRLRRPPRKWCTPLPLQGLQKGLHHYQRDVV